MISILTQIGFVVAYAVCGMLADFVFGPVLIIAGIVMVAFAFIFGFRKSIREMERSDFNELVDC